MVSAGLAFEYQLNQEKISGWWGWWHKTESSYLFVFETHHCNCFSLSIHSLNWSRYNICSVWSQFNTIALEGSPSAWFMLFSVIFPWTCAKSAKLYLPFDIIFFPAVIVSKGLLIYTFPPYSAQIFLLLANKKPLVAAITFCVVKRLSSFSCLLTIQLKLFGYFFI